MKKSFFVCLFMLVSAWLKSQDVQQSLIVVHVDPASKNQFKQQIYAYHFLNGSFTGRDELLTVVGRKEGKDYIRTDIGKNTIYKNRYLITGIGNIIDLREKKVLLDTRSTLVRCNNDSAVFYTNDIFKGKFYSVYDFKKSEYSEVKDLLFKPRLGKDVEFDKTTAPFKINYYPVGAEKITICEDAGYGQAGTAESHVPDPPLYWLDNANFIYSNFNKENTELAFYKLNIESKDSKLIGKVVITRESLPAEVFRLNETQALVALGYHQILIDHKEKTVSDLAFSSPGNNFSYECKPAAAGRIVKLSGKEIGKYHFNPLNFTTDINIAALVKEITVGTESYQQGISVWNNVNKSWAAVDAEEVLRLVGWINE